MKYKIFAERQSWTDSIALHLAKDINDKRFVAADIIFTELVEPEYSPPFLSLDITAAQRLMDELWHCGLRPSEGSGSAGSLAATERHLQDMRRLVFEGCERAEIVRQSEFNPDIKLTGDFP